MTKTKKKVAHNKKAWAYFEKYARYCERSDPQYFIEYNGKRIYRSDTADLFQALLAVWED